MVQYEEVLLLCRTAAVVCICAAVLCFSPHSASLFDMSYISITDNCSKVNAEEDEASTTISAATSASAIVVPAIPQSAAGTDTEQGGEGSAVAFPLGGLSGMAVVAVAAAMVGIVLYRRGM